VDLLLAVRKDRSVSELRLEGRTKQGLSARYSELRSRFFAEGTDIHDYVPAYGPGDEGTLKLTCSLPASIWDCREAQPDSIPILHRDSLAEGIRALIAVHGGEKPSFYFQAMDNRFMLRPGRAMFVEDGSLRLNDSTGIVVADRLDAIYEDGQLYFKSELVVRRFLKVKEFFTEASDEDVHKFFAGSTFVTADMESLKRMVTAQLRRKLHAIIRSHRRVEAKDILAGATRAELSLAVVDGRIVVPTDPTAFRELFRIIDESCLERMLDRRTQRRPRNAGEQKTLE